MKSRYTTKNYNIQTCRAQAGNTCKAKRTMLASPVADEVRILELVVEADLLAVHRQESHADGVFVVAARFSAELRRWRAKRKRRVGGTPMYLG